MAGQKAAQIVPQPKAKTVQPAIGKAEHSVSASVPWARAKRRHHLVLISFVFLFLLPALASVIYITTFAADQYHSTTAFSVRSEEIANPLDVLGAFTQVGSSSASDNDILYEFIQSQPLVEKLDRQLDLREIYNRRSEDRVFSLGNAPSIEDLTWYWGWMVSVSVGSTNGLIEVETRAFDPRDAQRVTEAILAESAALINDLSRIAREDATKYAREDLDTAEDRLRDIRLKVREFRNANQIIDVEAWAASQMGLSSVLESQLAEALVEQEILRTYASSDDPRMVRGRRRIEAFRNQIAIERSSISETGTGAGLRPLSDVIGEYEELLVDLEFSQTAYTAGLTAHEHAKAEARRQSRYLAVHVPPTVSQDPQYPQRVTLSILITAFLLATWAILVLVAYNVRDRR